MSEVQRYATSGLLFDITGDTGIIIIQFFREQRSVTTELACIY